jgi:hypothetical protein
MVEQKDTTQKIWAAYLSLSDPKKMWWISSSEHVSKMFQIHFCVVQSTSTWHHTFISYSALQFSISIHLGVLWDQWENRHPIIIFHLLTVDILHACQWKMSSYMEFSKPVQYSNSTEPLYLVCSNNCHNENPFCPVVLWYLLCSVVCEINSQVILCWSQYASFSWPFCILHDDLRFSSS